MIYQKIYLKDITNLDVGNESFMTLYIPDEEKEVVIDPRPVMVVCPGGGYNMISSREDWSIAFRYVSEGFSCISLHYSIKTAYPVPQLELAVVINYINQHAKEYRMDAKCINLVGFSAGGHLAASYSLYYKDLAKKLDVSSESLKPFSIVLGYPVIRKDLDTLSITIKTISGSNEEVAKKMDIVDNMTSDFPPTFVWTTKEDDFITPKNSIMLVDKLKSLHIPHQFVLFDHGVHGGSLCNHAVYDEKYDFNHIRENRTWVDQSVDFIFSLRK